MAKSWSGWYWHLAGASLVGMGGALASCGDCALAQIKPDGTLGADESSVVRSLALDSTVDVIESGVTRGANLFHSFEQFSVLTGREANFNNDSNVQNIISRVTGKLISNIGGLLRATLIGSRVLNHQCYCLKAAHRKDLNKTIIPFNSLLPMSAT